MLDIKDIQSELLKELNEICNEDDICYFFHGELARYALINGTIHGGPHNLVVAMTLPEAERFVKAVQRRNNPERYVESLMTNPRYNQEYIEYGNRNTTAYNLAVANKNNNHGISIRVYYIEDVSARKNTAIRKKLTKRWNTWNSTTVKDTYSRDKKRNQYDSVFSKVLPWNKWAREKYEDRHGLHAVNGFKDIPNHDKVAIANMTFDGKVFFDGVEYSLVDGVRIPFVANLDDYFASYLNTDWRTREFKTPPYNPRVIYDTSTGFEKNIDMLEREGLIKQVRESYDRVVIERNVKSEQNAILINRLMSMMDMTMLQVDFIDEIMPHKEMLCGLDLDNPEDMKIAEKHLEPIVKKLNRYRKEQLTFSVDNDIDELINTYLEKRGREKLVDKIKELRSKEILIP